MSIKCFSTFAPPCIIWRSCNVLSYFNVAKYEIYVVYNSLRIFFFLVAFSWLPKCLRTQLDIFCYNHTRNFSSSRYVAYQGLRYQKPEKKKGKYEQKKGWKGTKPSFCRNESHARRMMKAKKMKKVVGLKKWEKGKKTYILLRIGIFVISAGIRYKIQFRNICIQSRNRAIKMIKMKPFFAFSLLTPSSIFADGRVNTLKTCNTD